MILLNTFDTLVFFILQKLQKSKNVEQIPQQQINSQNRGDKLTVKKHLSDHLSQS